MIDILNGLIEALGDGLNGIISLLPLSPFKFEEAFDPVILGWINLVFPIGKMIAVLLTYLSAVALYYCYRIIMRWVKISGS